ncbi:MAG: helix-turn-helix transcriptional regulator [Lachnospiraceae bacterium]|nr:helix-turn-helix transcriptional regulator [Lachnospiraceae bacterium]
MEYNIGQFIASKRKELGYTQQYLADKLNISFQAVSKWEKGGSLS